MIATVVGFHTWRWWNSCQTANVLQCNCCWINSSSALLKIVQLRLPDIEKTYLDHVLQQRVRYKQRLVYTPASLAVWWNGWGQLASSVSCPTNQQYINKHGRWLDGWLDGWWGFCDILSTQILAMSCLKCLLVRRWQMIRELSSRVLT